MTESKCWEQQRVGTEESWRLSKAACGSGLSQVEMLAPVGVLVLMSNYKPLRVERNSFVGSEQIMGHSLWPLWPDTPSG